MERVVLGYDGSPAAESALDWVTERVSRRPARVQIVTASSPLRSEREDARRLLEAVERRLRARVPGLPVETIRAEGPAAGALGEVVAEGDLLVVGVDRDHPLRAALRGWIPQRVSASASSPVCIVPAG